MDLSPDISPDPFWKKVLDSFIKMVLHRTLQNIDTNEKYHYSFVLSQLCLPVNNPAFLNHVNRSKAIESKYNIHHAGVYFIIKVYFMKVFSNYCTKCTNKKGEIYNINYMFDLQLIHCNYPGFSPGERC